MCAPGSRPYKTPPRFYKTVRRFTTSALEFRRGITAAANESLATTLDTRDLLPAAAKNAIKIAFVYRSSSLVPLSFASNERRFCPPTTGCLSLEGQAQHFPLPNTSSPPSQHRRISPDIFDILVLCSGSSLYELGGGGERGDNTATTDSLSREHATLSLLFANISRDYYLSDATAIGVHARDFTPSTPFSPRVKCLALLISPRAKRRDNLSR